MSMDQCIKALALHARIDPIVTLTVWKELMRENKNFFKAYMAHAYKPMQNRGSRFRGFHWK